MKYKTDDLREKAEQDKNHSSLSAAENDFADEAAARNAFGVLRSKLSNVDEWNAHGLVSSFEIFEESGQPASDKKLSVGKFLRISLPGTFKYDWVRVASIRDEADEFIVTVKPTFDPAAAERDESVVSHFFTAESENNFCVARKGARLGMYVIGLNEKMNASETDNALETVRNAAVNLGTYLGMQRGEWEKFCHHFINDVAGEKAA
jgi:hypothetical protein